MLGKALLERELTHKAQIVLSGEEVADLFWQMGARDQAAFFNYLGSRLRLVFQLQSVADSQQLDHDGRWAMSRIGEYSEL